MVARSPRSKSKASTSAKPRKAAAATPKPPRRNVVPDSVDFRDRPYQPAIAFAPKAELHPPVAAHRPLLNQKDTSACTGFAVASAVHILTARREGKLPAAVAPFMLYGMARRYDEYRGDAPDGGSSVRGALKGWFKHGVCAQRFWRELAEPKPTGKRDWWDDGVLRPLGAYYRVDARSVVDMQVALNETGVLVASALAHDGWLEGNTAKRLVLQPGAAYWTIPYPWQARPDDGHAFAIVGYTADGFIVQNSWGSRWGTGGLALLTYEDWIEHGYDCWAVQLGVVTRQHRLQSRGAAATPGTAFGGGGTIVLDLHDVSPYVVNTGQDGELSRAGEFHTDLDDLKELVEFRLADHRREHGIPANAAVDVAIYAHGGLVSERAAGGSAKDWIDQLRPAGVFPIFLFWESDLFSLLEDRLLRELRNRGEIPTGGPIDALDEFWSDRVEGIARVAARWAWDDMKHKAARISSNPQGGGRLLVDLLAPQRAKIRLHLIGHSAGAVVHTHLLAYLVATGWNVESMNLMAPASTVDSFLQTLRPQLAAGKVKRLLQLHLADAVENDEGGSMRAALLYKRSLLYLISNAFEGTRGVPVLGMQKFFDAQVATLALPQVTVRVAPGSAASGAVRHGAFDNDPKTQGAVLTHIQGGAVPAP